MKFRYSTIALKGSKAGPLGERRARKERAKASGTPRLPDEQIALLRGDYELRGMTLTEVADKYKIAKTTAHNYINYYSRVHVDPK